MLVYHGLNVYQHFVTILLLKMTNVCLKSPAVYITIRLSQQTCVITQVGSETVVNQHPNKISLPFCLILISKILTWLASKYESFLSRYRPHTVYSYVDILNLSYLLCSFSLICELYIYTHQLCLLFMFKLYVFGVCSDPAMCHY